MNQPENLENIWKTQPLDKSVKGDEMRSVVLKKISAFDRTIRMRNIRETVAAVAVSAFFVYAAWVQRNGIARLGSGIVAAGALWIVYYLRRYGTGPAEPAPDQPVESFRRALVLKYEHQIRLLKSVKFWYLLPIYVGLITNYAGMLQQEAQTRRLLWLDAIAPLIYTLVFAGIWLLNEVYAVRKLEQTRAKIVAGLDEAAHC